MREITITEALAKLKLYEKRLEKLTNPLGKVTVIDYRVGTSTKGELSHLTEEELKREAQSHIDTIRDLLRNYRELKSKIAESNANTTIEIAGEIMSVAEAIERKRSINYQKNLLSQIKRAYTRVLDEIEEKNISAREEVDRLVETRLGSDAKSKSNDEITKLIDELYKLKKAELMDPLLVKNIIDSLEKDIEDFESNIDIALTISNSNTFIKIDF